MQVRFEMARTLLQLLSQIARYLLTLATAGTVSGCAGLFPPEFKFESISLVDSSADKNLTVFGRRMGAGLPLLKVDLSTETDMMKLAANSELNVYREVSMCGLGPGHRLKDWPGVFSGDFRVTGIGFVDDEKRRYRDVVKLLPVGPPYRIQIYFDWKSGRWESGSYGDPPNDAYDLSVSTHDVCVVIRGGAMWGVAGFIAKEVVVPKEAIQAALESVIKSPK